MFASRRGREGGRRWGEGGEGRKTQRKTQLHTHETRGPNNCGQVTLIQLPAGDSGSNKEKMTQLQAGRRSAGPGGGGVGGGGIWRGSRTGEGVGGKDTRKGNAQRRGWRICKNSRM